MEGGKSFTTTGLGKKTPETSEKEREDEKRTERKKENEDWTSLGTRGPKRGTSPAPRATKSGTRKLSMLICIEKAKKPTQLRRSVDRNAKTRLNRQGGGADR